MLARNRSTRPASGNLGLLDLAPLCSYRESVFMIPSVALVAGG